MVMHRPSPGPPSADGSEFYYPNPMSQSFGAEPPRVAIDLRWLFGGLSALALCGVTFVAARSGGQADSRAMDMAMAMIEKDRGNIEISCVSFVCPEVQLPGGGPQPQPAPVNTSPPSSGHMPALNVHQVAQNTDSTVAFQDASGGVLYVPHGTIRVQGVDLSGRPLEAVITITADSVQTEQGARRDLIRLTAITAITPIAGMESQMVPGGGTRPGTELVSNY